MAYEKQNFINGTVLDADHLNKIEEQILLNSNHNHNGVYAEVDHVHNDYSDKSHVHSGYATSEHNHDISDININKEARYAMSFFGVNPLSNNIEGATIDDDTPENWINFGTGYAYISAADRALMKNFPIGYSCYLHNYVYDTYIYQIIYPLTNSGTICHRVGSVSKGWYNNGVWKLERPQTPRLTNEQKTQIQNLIDQYYRVRNSLFYYTGAVRRECYAYIGSGKYTKYAYDTPKYPVLQHKNENIDSSNPDTEYFKYMLNCGMFCQMIWMGRPISDFLSGTTEEEKKLLSYAQGKEVDTNGVVLSSSKTEALKACPTVITNINSVFTDSSGNPWGYYFDFDLSQRAYGGIDDSSKLYNYNSYFDYDDTPIDIEISAVTTNDYDSRKEATGQAKAYSLTNQVLINSQFIVDIKNTISAGTRIHLGTMTEYLPSYPIPLSVHNKSYMFRGYIDEDNSGADQDDGKIFVYCNEELKSGTYYITVNAIYIPSKKVESKGKMVPLGFDGAANMAEELHALGYEVPYSEMEIGDLVFFKSQDISDDFRNKSEKSNDDALVNRLFRNISHVGIVYDFNSGYPVIADCTDSYTNPNVIGRTSMASSSAFARIKASYERNNVVMVARHPAAFGKGGNIPSEFTPYRGTKFGD